MLEKLRGGAARFLYGRNGTDELNGGLLILYVALVLLRSFLVLFFPYETLSMVFSLALLLLAGTIFFRLFSRNLPKRRQENARFLRWWSGKSAALARLRDRDHRYFRCKSCGALCRVPRGMGRIQITCPQCHHTMQAKS